MKVRGIALACWLMIAHFAGEAGAAVPTAPGKLPAPAKGWTWASPARSGSDAASVGVDTVRQKEEPAAPKPLDWSVGLNWSHVASTQLLGVGQDFLSSNHFRYIQALDLAASYVLVREKSYMLSVSAGLGLQTELTESNEAVQGRINQGDTALGATINLPLARSRGRLSTALTGSLIALLPTSRVSFSTGRFLLLSPRVGLLQRLPLAGKGAFLIDDVAAQLSLRYDRQFSLATTAVSPSFRRNRQDLFGNDLSDNVLSGGQIPSDSIRVGLNLQFDDSVAEVPVSLSLGTGFAVSLLPGVGDSQVVTATGTLDPRTTVEPRTARQQFSVRAALGAQATNYLGVSVAYSSTVDPAGLSPNPFNSPFSVFIANLSLSIDTLFAPQKAMMPMNRQ